MRTKRILSTVLTDLRWIAREQALHCNLVALMETVELALPLSGAALAMSIRDIRQGLLDCIHFEEDFGDAVCANRLRGTLRAMLGV